MTRWAHCLAALGTAACSSSGAASVTGAATDGAPVSISAISECLADAANPPSCIWGQASSSSFVAPATLLAGLFTSVPFEAQQPVATEALGSDGTWAFDLSALDAGGPSVRYFVEIVAQFEGDASVSRTIGPLSAGGPIAVYVLPVQLQVFESRAAGGGAMQLRSATAEVFDPSTGAEILDGSASVAITVGTTAVAMPWDDAAGAYAAEPSPAPDAQPAYEVTVAQPALGSIPTTWGLEAVVPGSDGTITFPAGDASVAPGSLTVTWEPATGIDYVQVEVFESTTESETDGGSVDATVRSASDAAAGVGPSYHLVYSSPAPRAPDVTQETIPAAALVQPGTYVISVNSWAASCPPTASGCVFAGTVSAVTVALVSSDGGNPAGDAGP